MAPVPKKSLFSKPAFSRDIAAKVSPSATATDLFSRADLSYSAFVEEEEEKRAERKNAKAARKAAESTTEDGRADNARKRQRISISSSDSSSGEGSTYDRRSKTLSPLPASSKIDVPSRTNASGARDAKLKDQPGHEEPELPDNDNRNAGSSKLHRQIPEVVSLSSSSPTMHSEPVELVDVDEQEEDERESDDEIAELARKAREAARKKQESQAENGVHSFHADPSSATQNDTFAGANAIPSVAIYVTSPLPGAENKSFKWRLDLQLRKMKLAWCEANGFSEEERQKIILMFRGRRVFDVNTPESLGIYVNNQGEAYVRGDDPHAPLGYFGDIVMEAIREEFEETYISKWRKKHGREVTAEDEDKAADALPQSADPAQKPVKIICRAKNFPDFKVAVKATTTVSRIQSAFVMRNELPEDTEVLVMLDGDILDADATITDLGIEDMDVLDIRVKHP